MIDKRVRSLAEAVAGIRDGSVVLCAGFGGAGLPVTRFCARQSSNRVRLRAWTVVAQQRRHRPQLGLPR